MAVNSYSEMLYPVSWIMSIVYAIPLIGALFYLFIKYQHSYWERRGIRSIKPHWFFGNLKDAIMLRVSPSILFGNLYQEGGEKDDVLGVYIFHKPFLLIRNPEIIKQILIKDFNQFCNRYFSAKSKSDKIGSSNLFAIDNPEWKHLRVKMSPAFTSGKLKKLFNLMVESATLMENFVFDQFKDGSKTKTIMVKDMYMKYTTNVISSLAFGIQTNSFDTPTPEFYRKSIEAFQFTFIRTVRFFFMFFFPNIGQYLGGRILNNSTDYFRNVFWDSMKSREESKTKRGDLIDSLIEIKNDKQDDFKFDDDALLGQSTVFFIAGRESSVTTLTFALYELAKRPDLQKRTREEILEKIGDSPMTYENIHEVKYLYQVISETLRLYPAAPLLDRVAGNDYKIPGTDITIEKGTPVYVSLTGIHYDAQYFPNPMVFDPDRFSDQNKDQIVPCTYMPFGEGPRICIGLRVGMLQTAVGLITILRHYEVSLLPNYSYGVNPRNIFMSPHNDFKLIFTKVS